MKRLFKKLSKKTILAILALIVSNKIAFLHTFNRKSVQRLSAVIFKLKIFKLVNGDPLPPVASLLIFLRFRYQLQSIGRKMLN